MDAPDKDPDLEESGNCADQVEFRFASDPKLLKIVRSAVAHLCELNGFSSQQCDQTILAVDEACSNIIKYAYEGKTDRTIIIKVRLLSNGIEIVLRDFGKKARLSNIQSRDLDDIRPGGLGVHFINSIMDVVSYDNSLKEGNRLTLAKYRVPEKLEHEKEF